MPLSGGACGAHGFKNFRRVIRIPNMCLVLKLDNGKVVSIANGQTHRVTQPSSTVLVYRYAAAGYFRACCSSVAGSCTMLNLCFL